MQPCLGFWREFLRELLPDVLMVVVDPGSLDARQLFGVDEFLLNGNQGDGFQAEEGRVVEGVGSLLFLNDAEILNADAKLSTFVVARFIADDHVLPQRLRCQGTLESIRNGDGTWTASQTDFD